VFSSPTPGLLLGEVETPPEAWSSSVAVTAVSTGCSVPLLADRSEGVVFSLAIASGAVDGATVFSSPESVGVLADLTDRNTRHLSSVMLRRYFEMMETETAFRSELQDGIEAYLLAVGADDLISDVLLPPCKTSPSALFIVDQVQPPRGRGRQSTETKRRDKTRLYVVSSSGDDYQSTLTSMLRHLNEFGSCTTDASRVAVVDDSTISSLYEDDDNEGEGDDVIEGDHVITIDFIL